MITKMANYCRCVKWVGDGGVPVLSLSWPFSFARSVCLLFCPANTPTFTPTLTHTRVRGGVEGVSECGRGCVGALVVEGGRGWGVVKEGKEVAC